MLELKKYIDLQRNWTGSDPQQRVVDLASLHCETSHKCDSYYYVVGENDFISPNTDLPIRPNIKTDTLVEKKEGAVYEDLFLWAKSYESGVAAWVSPSIPGELPATKVILHEISKRGSQRVVLNRVIMAEAKPDEAVQIANLLIPSSIDPGAILVDPEDTRGRLLIMREGRTVIDLLGQIVDDPQLIEDVKNGRDLADRGQILTAAQKYSDMIQSGASPAEIHKAMVRDRFIGNFNISCPPKTSLFSDLVLNNSVILGEGEYKYVKNCGNCGVTIEKLISKGYRCPSCSGEYKGC